jgi:hypothetical protein
MRTAAPFLEPPFAQSLLLIRLCSLTSCVSNKIRNGDMPSTERNPLKYPVVLVHGVVAHDNSKIISFWGRNDGVVSQYSASWGNNIFEIKGRISHAEIIDVKQRKIGGVYIPGIYISIVNELGRKGF